MSFFPSADPDEEQTPYSESQPFFSTQNSTSMAHLTGDDCFDFTLSYATTTHGLPSTQATAWTPAFDTPQGLGLQYPTTTFTPGYTGSTALSQPSTTSFSWPADFTPTPTPTPVASQQCFRRDSCSDNCEPPPTVQPSQLWEPFQAAATPVVARDSSPGRSEYSTSSLRSTASSPFVRAENLPRAVGSPMVKVESEPIFSRSPLFHGVTLSHQSASVDTQDFAVPGATKHDRRLSAAFVTASGSDAGDVKPSLRPAYRRARSAADTGELDYQSRRKRSLTRPENANCACEICGKPFQRCYNLKAHMDTHDANRSMPNKCRFPGCGKRFVRRTDLTRHNESVRRPTKILAAQ